MDSSGSHRSSGCQVSTGFLSFSGSHGSSLIPLILMVQFLFFSSFNTALLFFSGLSNCLCSLDIASLALLALVVLVLVVLTVSVCFFT